MMTTGLKIPVGFGRRLIEAFPVRYCASGLSHRESQCRVYALDPAERPHDYALAHPDLARWGRYRLKNGEETVAPDILDLMRDWRDHPDCKDPANGRIYAAMAGVKDRRLLGLMVTAESRDGSEHTIEFLEKRPLIPAINGGFVSIQGVLRALFGAKQLDNPVAASGVLSWYPKTAAEPAYEDLFHHTLGIRPHVDIGFQRNRWWLPGLDIEALKRAVLPEKTSWPPGRKSA